MQARRRRELLVGARAATVRRGSASFQFRSSTVVARLIRALLPAPMQATVKNLLSPTIALDYDGTPILICADSPMDLNRSCPCRKEPGTVEWIESNVRPGDVFYDVGANVGSYAMIAAVQAPGKVVSHAFEPSFSTYGQLCRNVILNGLEAQVFPHMIALANITGSSVFNYQSLAAGSSLHAAGDNVDYRGNSFEPVYRQRVLAFSIDDLVSDWGFEVPSHIKIDVDGIELKVLLGARAVLADHRLRTVLVEVCHDRGDSRSVRDLMTANGFELESERVLAEAVSNWVFARR